MIRSGRKSKLTPEQVADIRHLADEGFLHKEIAQKYKISRHYATRIINKKRWADQTKPVHKEIKHGHYSDNRETKVHRGWRNMVSRCHNPYDKDYPRWGAKGISVCLRWRESFEAFLSDMGLPPKANFSIDRINNAGNYEPSNCRWASPSQQQQNRRDNRFSQEMAADIRAKRASGMSYYAIAKEYGCDHAPIRKICLGLLWKDPVAKIE